MQALPPRPASARRARGDAVQAARLERMAKSHMGLAMTSERTCRPTPAKRIKPRTTAQASMAEKKKIPGTHIALRHQVGSFLDDAAMLYLIPWPYCHTKDPSPNAHTGVTHPNGGDEVPIPVSAATRIARPANWNGAATQHKTQ